MVTKLDQSYWNERYESGYTGWDIGHVADPLKAYFDQLTNKDLSILIPGGGNSYEAIYLMEQGFTNVTIVDISTVVTERLQKNHAQWLDKGLQIICLDFFDLDRQFDRIIEQTFFCALLPDLREAYAKKMASLLKPGGKIAGVWFNREFEGGPPFGGDVRDYTTLFSRYFESVDFTPCYNSIEPRKNAEVFGLISAPKS
jgi:SAM-dependent methyltransferase